jgi:Domain of unknown function (DUF4266)
MTPFERQRPHSFALFACAVLGVASATGCTHVAAYDRARLAYPSMTESYEGAMSAHVRAVHEGASGGGSVAESGCGCN